MSNSTPSIVFSEFNAHRAARGVEAARFEVVGADRVSTSLWMSASDIQKNLAKFPHAQQELKKGLAAYSA